MKMVLSLSVRYLCNHIKTICMFSSVQCPIAVVHGVINPFTFRIMHTICTLSCFVVVNSLRWHHNGHDGISNHQPHYCLLNRLFGCRSKKTSKLRVTGLCAGNSPEAGELPAQMTSNAENVTFWWRHHVRDPDQWGWWKRLCDSNLGHH